MDITIPQHWESDSRPKLISYSSLPLWVEYLRGAFVIYQHLRIAVGRPAFFSLHRYARQLPEGFSQSLHEPRA